MKTQKILSPLLPLLLASCSVVNPASSSTSASSVSSSEAPSSTSSASSSEASTPYQLDLNVAAPSGAPAVSLYRHIADEKVEINADPANVVAYLSASSGKDIVICPTNAGVSAITKKSAPYKLAATITFGNFYLAGTGNDENKTLDKDDYVVLFQQNNVPDKLFQYVYGDLGLSNVHYVNAATDAQQTLISKKNLSDDNADVDYVLIAEPAFTGAKSKNADAYEYASIQEEFAKKSNGQQITQASIFVSNSTEKAKADAFLSSINADVTAFLANPSVLDEATAGLDDTFVQSKIGVPAAMLKKMASANNRMGLGYKEAKGNKDAVTTFCSLFGLTLNEEVYYQ